jgi:uncharacterized protein YndB with AHSA1/START domain
MNVITKPDGQVLELTRVLKAPRERVFAAWTDVAQANRWWAPRDFEILSCTMEVRPGGRWHRSMRSPAGDVVTKYGVYREVVPPERLVFTYRTEMGGQLDDETVVVVTFDAVSQGTLLTLRHAGFASESLRDDHRGGWSSCLDRFAAFSAEA